MNRIVIIAAITTLAASAELLHVAPGSAQESGSSKTIDARSLCGTWQSIGGSGGIHQITTVSGNGTLKAAGFHREGDPIKYTITDAGLRTAEAIQTINMKQGYSFHIGDGFKSKAVRRLVGVTSKNMIVFAVEGEPGTETWTPLSPGMYDVSAIETGPHAMSYYYKIKQTSKSSCRAD
jgi:hypothetical protein